MRRIILLTLSVSGVLLGCARTATPRTGPPAPSADTSDVALFSAVVQSLAPGGNRHLFVDPRPLMVRAHQGFVRQEDLVDDAPAAVSARVAVLERLGQDTISIFERQHRCRQGPGGLPPRDPDEEYLRISRLPPTECLVVSLPRLGGPARPEDSQSREGESASTEQDVWTVRAWLLRRSTYRVLDVVLRPKPGGGWEAVEKVDLWVIMS
jgi:hypothetical protein